MPAKTPWLFCASSLMLVALSTCSMASGANVFNMGGTRNADGSWNGLASLQTVPVGNPSNAWDVKPDSSRYGRVTTSYHIGKYEVTAAQYTQFLNAVAKADTYGLYNPDMASALAYGCMIERHGEVNNYTYSVAADYANRPVNHVSWGDAARFANWLHNGQPTGTQDINTTERGAYNLNGATTATALLAVQRQAGWKWAIPTENEWYKAAYYDPTSGVYYDYPMGSDSRPSNDLLANDAGNNGNFDEFGQTIGSPYYRTEVGAFENSYSPYGTFDQGGNVWEWNELVYGSTRGLRGGSFNNSFASLESWSGSSGISPANETYHTGFRVVTTVPEPASMTLLALSALGLLKRRKSA